MKQEVCIVGAELSRLVPFSLALRNADYAVTLAEAPDVMARARSSAVASGGWLVVVLAGEETVDDCSALLRLQPLTLFVTSPQQEQLRRRFIELDLPVVAEHEGPLAALATLLAMSRWAESATKPSPSQTARPSSMG